MDANIVTHIHVHGEVITVTEKSVSVIIIINLLFASELSNLLRNIPSLLNQIFHSWQIMFCFPLSLSLTDINSFLCQFKNKMFHLP